MGLYKPSEREIPKQMEDIEDIKQARPKYDKGSFDGQEFITLKPCGSVKCTGLESCS